MSTEWNIEKVLAFAVPFFANKGFPTPRLDAEVLLASVLEKERIFLYSHYDTPLKHKELTRYREFLKRRCLGEPVAYITGFKEFMSLPLEVSPQVLIPRPDTEVLVETAIELITNHRLKHVADIGTGSGAIAISVAHYTGKIKPRMFATDISMEALLVAKRNAAAHQVEIDFRQGHLLEPLLKEENLKLDLILANLPYVADSDFASLPPDVREYEPYTALLGGSDGLDFYRQLLPMASHILKAGGFMLWEIDDKQAESAKEILTAEFSYISIIKDLAGQRRVIKAVKN